MTDNKDHRSESAKFRERLARTPRPIADSQGKVIKGYVYEYDPATRELIETKPAE